MKYVEQNVKELFQVTSNFSYGWTPDDQIMLLKITGSDRQTVDAWVNHIIETRMSWPEGQPLYMLSDYRNSDMIATPYFRESVPRLLKANPDLVTYTAFVVDKSIGARIIEFGVRMMPASKTVHTHIFYKPEEALTWLRSV